MFFLFFFYYLCVTTTLLALVDPSLTPNDLCFLWFILVTVLIVFTDLGVDGMVALAALLTLGW